ncbi:hypothetical protein ACFR97_16595 [Haloplanus litoreus]|uniref:DoxX-like family protein n=1 Tax=Haloplanus litoreus TaxID=767515 RepID=A0ABD6A3H3_9EURY
MLRKVLTSITIVEALWPETLIDTAEGIALDNPDECELKSWVVPGARLEGLVFLVLMWRSNTSYSRFKKFLGVIGILALLYPRAYVDYAAEIAYTDATTCEWKSWVYPGTRLIGLLYVSIALAELRKR